MRTLLTAGFFSSAFFPSIQACNNNCTERGCDNIVEVRFQPAISAAGLYTFIVNANGEESTCDIDFDPNEELSGFSTCPGLLAEGTRSTIASTPPGPPYMIVGFDLPSATTITVRVDRGSVLVADSTVEPEFMNVEINGEGCGECRIGRAEITVPE